MKKLTIAIALLTLAILPMACQKEKTGNEQFRFTATTERPQSDDSKVRLVDERFIVWEYDDEISIGSNTSGSDKHQAWLYYADPHSEDWSDYNGVFLTSLPSDSRYFLGLHPHSDNNSIVSQNSATANFSVTIDIPATQTYRNDSTFDKQVFPMVAWYGGNWSGDPYTPFNLDFHSLGSIVRLQFVNNTGANSNIRSITVTSPDKQLCGLFTVNNYNTFDPHLTSVEPTKKTVTIDCGNLGVAFDNNKLLTFYLVLPAFAGRDNTTEYNNLTITVTNLMNQTCSINGSVSTRRNGISYMQALSIDSWGSAPTPTIAGNGTEDRPFKIYDINDLQYLRDCYNDPARTINGQSITADTYIKLMRSDIVLTQDNWNVGIRDFEGHFLTMNQQSNSGITNSCRNVPVFENIGSHGEVRGLTVKSSVVFNGSVADGVSPFCTRNDGRIIDCALTSKPGSSDYTLSIFSPFAGICVTNNGTIQGCRCDARVEVQDNKNFAGICLHNNGTIQGCQAGNMTLRITAQAAGICYENSSTGTVKDCYFAANIMSSSADWGGIVYENSGTVKHCYMSATGHIYTSKGVGGIVRNNIGSSLVDYCYVAGPLQGRTVGGIVDSLVSGEVRNCFNRNSAMISVTTASGVGGGLVGYVKGGQVNNSYVNEITITRSSNSAVIGGIAGAVTGGSFSYCYSYEDNNNFYGTTTAATYDHCYIVDGTQANILTASSSDFPTLTTNLNSSGNSNYSTWVQADNSSAPELEAYQE